MPNGDLEMPPVDPTLAISDVNGNSLPYWSTAAVGSTLTATYINETNTQGAIAIAATSGTLTDAITFTQIVPVPIAASQSRIVVPVIALSSSLKAGALTATLTCTYLQPDAATVVTNANGASTVSTTILSSALADPTTGTPTEIFVPTGTMGQLPRAAAFVQVDVSISVTTGSVADDIRFHDARVEQIPTALGINAAYINVGQLTIGGTDAVSGADSVVVLDATDRQIGVWGPQGLIAVDPTNANRLVRVLNGAVSFSIDGGINWATGLTADGVVADAIKSGQLPGGSNAIPNASYELSAFATTNSVSWATSGTALPVPPTAGGFGSTFGTNYNAGTAGSSLTMSTATY
jgi:hypothetical protein